MALALGGPVWRPRATLLAPSATWPWPGAAARPGAIPLIGNAKWRLANKVTMALRVPGVGAPCHFIDHQRHLAMAWRRRQAMGTPSNWERPVNGNAITLYIRKRCFSKLRFPSELNRCALYVVRW